MPKIYRFNKLSVFKRIFKNIYKSHLIKQRVMLILRIRELLEHKKNRVAHPDEIIQKTKKKIKEKIIY